MAQPSWGQGAGPNPRRVRRLPELARELDLLRARAAAGTMKAKVSLEDLARLVRLPRSTLHSYMTGQTLVPSDMLDRIVLALGADPAEQREWNDAWYRVRAGDHDQAPADAYFDLPAVIRGFTGRTAELAELDRMLESVLLNGGNGLVTAVVSGAPGVGKTALALRWAHRARDRFPDGCVYLDLQGFAPDQPIDPGTALAVLLGFLLPGEPVPAEPAVRAARYRARLDGRRMLVLLDNAACAEQVRPLLPGSGSCMVIATSRDDLAGLVAREGAQRIDLAVLPQPDALTLLEILLGADRVGADRGAAATLAERCGRLPLALRVAAELAASRPAESLAEIGAGGGDHPLDWLAAGGDARSDVRAVFSWSYHRLLRGHPEAARAFRLLGAHPSAEFTAASLAGLAEHGTGRLVDTLARAHLVETATPGGRFRMLGPLRAYASELAGACGAGCGPEPAGAGPASLSG